MTLLRKWTLEDHWLLVLKKMSATDVANETFLEHWNVKEATFVLTITPSVALLFDSKRKAEKLAEQVRDVTLGKANQALFEPVPASAYLGFKYQFDIDTGAVFYDTVELVDAHENIAAFAGEEIKNLEADVKTQLHEISNLKIDHYKEHGRMERSHKQELQGLEDDWYENTKSYQERAKHLLDAIKILQKLLPKKKAVKKTKTYRKKKTARK
jgi:hypothetical protein